MDITYCFVKVSNRLHRVDCASGCGKRFEGIAVIMDGFRRKPDGSSAAAIQVPKPLGTQAVTEILEQWEGFVQRQGGQSSDGN